LESENHPEKYSFKIIPKPWESTNWASSWEEKTVMKQLKPLKAPKSFS
jgi:hypothetical protein